MNFEKLFKIREEFIAKEISKNGIETKDGLIELLDFLKNNNYRMAVASSSEEKNIRTYLDKLNVIKDDVVDYIPVSISKIKSIDKQL